MVKISICGSCSFFEHWSNTVLMTSSQVNVDLQTCFLFCATPMGGDLGGRSPPKFEMGAGLCIRPPNISRSSVIGCVSKLKLSKKGVIKEFFVLKLRTFS